VIQIFHVVLFQKEVDVAGVDCGLIFGIDELDPDLDESGWIRFLEQFEGGFAVGDVFVFGVNQNYIIEKFEEMRVESF